MYTKDDIKFYFDKISEMKDKVNAFQDDTKKLMYDLPAPLHQKIKLAHNHLYALRDSFHDMDKIVEKLRDSESKAT